MTEPTPERSPDDPMDVDKEARMLLNPPGESVCFFFAITLPAQILYYYNQTP